MKIVGRPILLVLFSVGMSVGMAWAQEPPAPAPPQSAPPAPPPAPAVPAPPEATPPAPATPVPDVTPPPAPAIPMPHDTPRASSCQALKDQVSERVSPIQILSEKEVPSGPQKSALSTVDAKCAESLRAAGKRAIEQKKAALGIHRYLAAVDTTPALASEIYRELGYELDKAAYAKPAILAYLKAWKALDLEGAKPDTKVESITVLSMADIRDSLARLGAQVPTPSSELGKIVIANSTRALREKYFGAFPPAQ